MNGSFEGILLTAEQKKALEETKMVIPGLREKITNAREKLESFLVSFGATPRCLAERGWETVERTCAYSTCRIRRPMMRRRTRLLRC